MWKTAAVLGMAAAGAWGGEGPARLALELDAEGQRDAAAVEFRRLALGAETPEAAAGWFWLAAQEYALDGRWELSNRMLDRAEDEAPFALSVPVAWRRAENALGEGDWTAASFHFDSLRGKADSDGVCGVAACGAAAARLREGNAAGARQSLAEAPGDLEAARGAIEAYAARRDKKPWVGGVLGIVPGFGYLYSGEYANAARSIILNGLFLWGMAETAEDDEWGIFAVLTFAEFTWYSGSIYGGIDAAHRHNRGRLDSAVEAVRGGLNLQPDLGQVPVVTLRVEF